MNRKASTGRAHGGFSRLAAGLLLGAAALLAAACGPAPADEAPARQGISAPGPEETGAAVRELFGGMEEPGDSGPEGPTISWDAWKIAGIVAGILLLAGLSFWAYRVLARRRRLGGAAPSVPVPAGDGPPLDPPSVLAAREGDFGKAVVLLRDECMELFARRGLLPRRPSTTPGDALGKLDSASALRFRALARTADGHVFGERPVGPGDWEEARAAWLFLAEGGG